MPGSAQKGKTEKVAIVIPCYNEASIIGSVLNNIQKNKTAKHYDVIVVNDGSTDDSARVLSAHRDIRVINHVVNMGAGAATRTGLVTAKNSGYDYAITLDADGQHTIEDALNVLRTAQKTGDDLTIGSRLDDRKGMPKVKVFGNKLLNLVSYLIVGVMVSDSQSGLRVLNKKCLNTLTFYTNGYGFCSEMIWHAKKQGLTIGESPIGAIYTDYSKGKGQKNVGGFVAIVGSLVKQRMKGFLNE